MFHYMIGVNIMKKYSDEVELVAEFGAKVRSEIFERDGIFYIPKEVYSGYSMLYDEDCKSWTRVHKFKGKWYVASRWSEALAEGRLQQYLDGLKE